MLSSLTRWPSPPLWRGTGSVDWPSGVVLVPLSCRLQAQFDKETQSSSHGEVRVVASPP